jgi:Flp pilus assembly protein TadG
MKILKRNQRGVALIELALIIPLLMLLTFITTEFGRAVYEYNTLTKAARDAVRYLSFQTPGTHITQAQNLMVYGNLAGTGSPLARGLSLSNVPAGSCCTWQTTGSNPAMTTVTVRVSNYTFQPLLPSFLGLAFGDANGDIVFTDITATMRGPT